MAELPPAASVDTFLNKVSENDKKGLVDLQNLSLTMGLPAARATFSAMAGAAQLNGKKKTKIHNKIQNISPLTEVGCFKVDFRDKATGEARVLYMVLEECPPDHDLDAEFGKLKPHVTEEKWGEVCKHLSMLVYLARKTYEDVAKNNIELIREIFGLPSSDPCTEYLNYSVDLRNTTLFIKPDWPVRIGIFIRQDESV
jgi:hypothetical protein